MSGYLHEIASHILSVYKRELSARLTDSGKNASPDSNIKLVSVSGRIKHFSSFNSGSLDSVSDRRIVVKCAA